MAILMPKILASHDYFYNMIKNYTQMRFFALQCATFLQVDLQYSCAIFWRTHTPAHLRFGGLRY